MRQILLGRCFNMPGAILLGYSAECLRVGEIVLWLAMVLLAASVSYFGGRWAER